MANQRAIPAVYMRGGTSRALIFHARDLPDDRASWDMIFAAALGSPDPNGRQLDGLGGGISSLSKVAVVAKSDHPHADVDYTFGQVRVDAISTSYKGNCGNISAAIGPFAVEEGLVRTDGDRATIRIRNMNTGKIIHAEFALEDGLPKIHGDFEISGIAGSGSPIRLAFLDPGGAATGKLLPAGQATTDLMVEGTAIQTSLVDAANPVVFVDAESLGMSGDEAPSTIGSNVELMRRLESLRVSASLAMGVAADREEATTIVTNLPLIAIVSPPRDDGANVQVRMISAGQPHKATPLTGALCLAAAAELPDTIVARLSRVRRENTPFRIAHPGGTLAVEAVVRDGAVLEAVIFRTARRLMEGAVLIPTHGTVK